MYKLRHSRKSYSTISSLTQVSSLSPTVDEGQRIHYLAFFSLYQGCIIKTLLGCPLSYTYNK